MDGPGSVPAQKAHRASRNKAKKKTSTSTGTGGKKNAVAKPGAFARRVRLAADRSEKRATNPTAPVDRTRGDTVPRVCAVVGPSGVGKSTVIRNLVKHYSKRNIPSVTGPITLVSGCKKRLTFIEVGPHLASMIDVAKVADLVLLVVDAGFGFEMETFEFLNILSAHGMPKVITVLTNLDKMRDGRQVRRAKKAFKDRIWAELYDGAKVFYLSGITTTGDYLSREILNLARFISVSKFPVLRWRAEHPYILADRVEDITPRSLPETANRTVAAYGYVRGTPLRSAGGEWRLHLAGVADLVAKNIEPLPDPCPPPQTPGQGTTSTTDAQKKRRKVTERERILYAPMAPEVDGIAYDRDAVYINLNPENIRFSGKSTLVREADQEEDSEEDGEASSDGEGEKMVKTLQKNDVVPVDQSLRRAELQLVAGGKPLLSENFETRRRRRAVFDGSDGDESDGGEDDESVEVGGASDDDDIAHMVKGIQEKQTISGSKSKKNGSHSYVSNDEESGVDGDSDFDEESDEEGETSDDTDYLSAGGDGSTINSEKETDGDGDGASGEDDDDGELDNGSDDEDDPNEYAAQRWKDIMLKNAEKTIKSTISASKALVKFIYDKNENGEYASAKAGEEIGKTSSDEADDLAEEEDAFFRPRRKRTLEGKVGDLLSIPESALDDITRILPNSVRDWASNESLCQRLKRKRWGTGQTLRDAEDGDSKDDEAGEEGDEVDGDFEDLETGQVHKANSNAEKDGAKGNEDADNDSDLEAIQADKIRQKQKFNMDWDSGRGRGNDTEDGSGQQKKPDVRSRKALRGEADREPDFRKVERERVEKLKEEELGCMDADSRMALEGMVPGQYVRLELQDVPVEFVKCFNPKYPLVLGGLRQADDEGETFLRARIRRHRFKRGVLKSNDPVVFSIGWRRFQSLPVYDTEDVNGRRRLLKYTPEHLHCNTSFWGASVAPGAGVVMCQTLGRERGGFRIAATGVVTEVDSDVKIVKKLKLVGEAVKIHRNTAFIKGMFNSELEASKYVGAAIRTVSGVRGTIKKAISESAQRGGLDRDVARAPTGTFRAGFEDKILLSDIVFLRAWVQVEVKKFCSVATTMLEEDSGRAGGVGTWRMRTVREVREANKLAIPLKQDSLYREVERGTPVFAPFHIPKKLEGALPFATKPKTFAPIAGNKKSGKPVPERKADLRMERAVVTDIAERKERQLLHAVYNIRKERTVKKKESKEKKLKEKKREWAREEEKHSKTSKALKKRKFAIEGAKEARDSKRGRKGGGRHGGDGDGDGEDE